MEPDAVTDAADTSLQRTYRYLRLTIVGVVIVIVVAVAFAAAVIGVLDSVSAYFYSPARNAIVGALVAGAVGMLALSGRGLQRALIDAAAVLLPLIAFVPTPIAPGQVPGVTVTCMDAAACVPLAFEPDVDNGVATYLVVGGLAVLVALGLAIWGPVGRAWQSILPAAFVLVAVGITWWWAHEAFLAYGHFVATVGFFALLAAVALVEAWGRGSGPPASRPVRVAYAIIAALLLIDLLVVTVAVLIGGQKMADGEAFVPPAVPVVLVGELLALALFAAFWLLQTRRTWNDPDPSLR